MKDNISILLKENRSTLTSLVAMARIDLLQLLLFSL